MMIPELNEKGVIPGDPLHFSKANDYKGEYISPREGETYAAYNKRVKEAMYQGFSLSDLSYDDYEIYCKGSGSYDDFNADQLIYG